jgi:N-acetylated-alpha-linked acidic dipeptidase
VGDLGAGSDYSPFVQHLGIASINLGFGGEDEQFGIIQSIYDTYQHFERFGDPDLTYEVALASTAGRLVLRSANADVLPLAFGDLADKIGAQVGELRRLVESIGDRARAHNALVDRRVFTLAADPTKFAAIPARESEPPDVDLRPLDEAVIRLKASAQAYDPALARAPRLTPEEQRSVNATLLAFERCLLHPEGLPGRPWYRNLLYAPGMTTGYAAKTLPGVREAIEARRWSEAGDYARWTARALQNCTERIDHATSMLTP